MNAPVRAVLVDDERLARAELRRLLADHPQVEVVGEAADVDAAVATIAARRPDLVFLDIQMPGGTGFDVLARLETVPAVIFATAFDEHALRAFEVNALDYLVKPIEPTRLAAALERAMGGADRAGAPSGDATAVGSAPGTASGPDGADPAAPDRLHPDARVFVRDGDRCWFVRLGDVRLFEAADNYARVRFGGEAPLIQRSLAHLEQRLDPAVFFRANRSQLVNLGAVRGIEPTHDGRLRLVLDDDREVVVSRRRASEFRERLML